MKPSERINAIAAEIHNRGIDPLFNGGLPTVNDYLLAIINYLDEQADASRERLT